MGGQQVCKRVTFLCGSYRREFASLLIQMVDKFQFLVITEPRSLFPCWMSKAFLCYPLDSLARSPHSIFEAGEGWPNPSQAWISPASCFITPLWHFLWFWLWKVLPWNWDYEIRMQSLEQSREIPISRYKCWTICLKYLSQNNVIYSQVQEITVLASLKGHYSTYHN